MAVVVYESDIPDLSIVTSQLAVSTCITDCCTAFIFIRTTMMYTYS